MPVISFNSIRISPGFIFAFSLISSPPSTSILVGCCSKLRRFLVEIITISSIACSSSNGLADIEDVIIEELKHRRTMLVLTIVMGNLMMHHETIPFLSQAFIFPFRSCKLIKVFLITIPIKNFHSQ